MTGIKDAPRIKLEDLLEEVMIHHIDNGFKRVAAELRARPEVDAILSEKIMASHEATQVTLGISAMTSLPPPKASTALHIGVAMGIGLVLELLNERENVDTPPVPEEPEPCKGSPTIQ